MTSAIYDLDAFRRITQGGPGTRVAVAFTVIITLASRFCFNLVPSMNELNKICQGHQIGLGLWLVT